MDFLTTNDWLAIEPDLSIIGYLTNPFSPRPLILIPSILPVPAASQWWLVLQ
jgi:hypothetical protein